MVMPAHHTPTASATTVRNAVPAAALKPGFPIPTSAALPPPQPRRVTAPVSDANWVAGNAIPQWMLVLRSCANFSVAMRDNRQVIRLKMGGRDVCGKFALFGSSEKGCQTNPCPRLHVSDTGAVLTATLPQ